MIHLTIALPEPTRSGRTTRAFNQRLMSRLMWTTHVHNSYPRHTHVHSSCPHHVICEPSPQLMSTTHVLVISPQHMCTSQVHNSCSQSTSLSLIQSDLVSTYWDALVSETGGHSLCPRRPQRMLTTQVHHDLEMIDGRPPVASPADD